ncbi:MAG TPA: hypothetical protein VIV54_19290 [Burkholderiales bacterium]
MPPQTPLVYSGATTGATVSATSTGSIAADVMGSSGAGMGSSLLSGVSAQTDYAPDPQPTGATGLARRLAQAIRGDELAGARTGGALAGATINQTIPCDSGSINISGTVADNTGTGTVSVDYVDCRTGSDTLNGPASLNIAAYDQSKGIVTDGTLSFTRVRFTGPGFNSDLTGTLRTEVSVSGATETFTQNVIVQDNATMRMMRTENLRIANAYSTVTAPTFFTQSISGRVFDSVAGYVDVSTETAPYTAPWGPLYFATKAQSFPDWGIINLAGAAGRARITAIGIDLVKVEVDANGDGVYENSARMRWGDLATALGSNLADSDGDGMHDSWEIAKGLNPNANDANADGDSDGYTNMTEYLAGSDPMTNGSIPPAVRHLWVTNVRDLAFDEASGQIQVFVGATGSGVLLSPVTRELGAPFSGATEPNGSANRTVTDAQGRTFTLSPTAVPTTWTLSSSTGTSITISNVGGTDPGSLIRYGARGLAFRTVGTASPGYVYLVESTQLIP